MSEHARFSIGQVIHHRLFDYRGVIIDVDPEFQGDDEWYDMVAQTKPPKFEPWYHVLVDNAIHRTYVAEQNIEVETEPDSINHPEINDFFKDFTDGHYIPHQLNN